MEVTTEPVVKTKPTDFQETSMEAEATDTAAMSETIDSREATMEVEPTDIAVMSETTDSQETTIEDETTRTPFKRKRESTASRESALEAAVTKTTLLNIVADSDRYVSDCSHRTITLHSPPPSQTPRLPEPSSVGDAVAISILMF